MIRNQARKYFIHDEDICASLKIARAVIDPIARIQKSNGVQIIPEEKIVQAKKRLLGMEKWTNAIDW